MVKDLWFRYPGTEFVLKNLSLHINRGEFVALVGKNGSGKTTLAKHFNGLLRPCRGVVEVNGADTREFSTAQLAQHIGYLSQQPHLQVCTSTVSDEVGFSLKVRGLPRLTIEETVRRWLDKLDLLAVADVHPYKLTSSQLKRMALASCLVNDPPILVLDEPTSGLTHPQDWQIMDLLATLRMAGRTIVAITHDLELVRPYCSRVVALEPVASTPTFMRKRPGHETAARL